MLPGYVYRKVVNVMGIREVVIIVQNIFDLPVISNLCDLKFHNCSLSILKKKKNVYTWTLSGKQNIEKLIHRNNIPFLGGDLYQ